jgi:hypothetical protein
MSLKACLSAFVRGVGPLHQPDNNEDGLLQISLQRRQNRH